jgi:Reverse transcriptase (RNA-dependent DNA polymerase)
MIKYREKYHVVGAQKETSPNKVRYPFKDMYTNIVTCVRACDGESDTFSIKIRLHQGSALSPYIFTLVMDEITKDIQEDIPWCMLFTDDVVLIDESRIEVNQKLELWRQTLESNVLDLVGPKLNI